MSQIDAIRCQIRAVGEHMTGPAGYSRASLFEVLDEISNAQDAILAEIARRNQPADTKPGFMGLLAHLDVPEPEGAA